METATMVGRSDQSGVDIIVPASPQTGRLKRNRHRSMISYKDDREVTLPDLRQKTMSLDRHQPLPTSLQSDFIPSELLFALTAVSPPQEQLGPPSKQKRSPSVSQTIVKKSPANMWNFSTQRDKYRHLTDSTPCICGAGQDISFLYDVQKDKGKMEKTILGDESELRHREVGEIKHTIQLPDTLIPAEYHIVKNKGVMGLDYFEDKYGLELKDHEKHLVLFPSMHPTTRFEVLQLRKTMFDMLEKIGIDDEYEEVKGPTQMHSLLELMKKEQNIYNVVFHELIRQVSVHCIERGSLLAEVRDRYSKLLSRVPRQIKGLHEEVLAQRALDRRLTEELLRFKTTISFLTSELTEVKTHDRDVTVQANETLEDLNMALGESQRNAALLAEYHDLYELQRQRLDRQVTILSSEKELWSTAAYSLALKVTEEHSLNTAKRLHVSEKAWAKLANHFTVLLSDRDTEVLIKLQSFADTFREILDTFSQKATHHERNVQEKLLNVMGEMHNMKKDFQKNTFGKGGELQNVPDMDKITKIYRDIKRWGTVCSDEMERFGGESLLTGQDTLRRVTAQVEGWTDCAIQLFNRHNVEGTTEHPNHAGMLRITEMVEEVVAQFQVRISGENGVASRLITLGNSLESIENKMSSGVHGANPMLDQEWMSFYQLLEDWCGLIDGTLRLLGNVNKEEVDCIARPKIEVFDVIRQLQRWLSTSVASIDSEDAKLVEAVMNLHTDMVQWMVHMLLRLAPNRKDASREAREALLLNTHTVGQLQLTGVSLFDQLQKFTKYVTSCCADIVREEMQKGMELQEDNADQEYKDLQKLQAECNEWIKIAKLLLQEVTGQPPPEPLPPAPPVQQPPKTPKLAARMSSTVLLPTMTEEEDEEEEDAEEREGEEREGEEPQEEQREMKGLPSPPPAEVAEMVRSDAMEPFPKLAEKVGKLDLESAASLPTMIEEEGTEEEGTPGAEEEAQAFGEDEGQSTMGEEEKNGGWSAEPLEVAVEEDDGVMKLEVLGADANTYLRRLQPDELPDLGDGPMTSPPIIPQPMTPDSKKAFESLQSVYLLQQQLLSAEERAQKAEERITDTERKLRDLECRNRELESRLTSGSSPSGSNTSLSNESATVRVSPHSSQHAQLGSKQAMLTEAPGAGVAVANIPPKEEPKEGKEKHHKERGRGSITKPKSGKPKSKK